MNCDKNLIILYACNEIEEDQLQELKSHLAECGDCQTYLLEFQQLSHAFTKLPKLRPRTDILESVLSRQRSRFSLWNVINSLNPRLVATAGVAVLVISIVVPMDPPPERSVETPDENFVWKADLDTHLLRHRVQRLQDRDSTSAPPTPVKRKQITHVQYLRHRIASIRKRQW